MYIPAPSRDKMTGLDIKTAGCQTLDGTEALAWVRSRYYQYYEAGKWRSDPTADLGRIGRQQEFLRTLMAQAVQKGALNPLKANRLADAAMANLTVDSTLDVKDALRLVEAFRPVGASGIEMTALPTKPDGAHLLVAPAAQPILARLRGETAPPPAGGEASAATPAPKVAPADVKVRVLNGTGTPGVAGDASAALGQAGFSLAGSGDADKFGYTKTQIRYGPAAQAKAALLARYLGGAGQLVADPSVRGTDVVLVVGSDWKGVTAPAAGGQSAAATQPAAPTSTSGPASTGTAAPAGASAAQPAC